MDKNKPMKIIDIQVVAERVAVKTIEKHMSYGGALDVSHRILNELYPDGVLPGQFFEFEVVSRIVEKLCRITRGNPVAYGESPWEDIIGYSLLAHKEFHNKELITVNMKECYHKVEPEVKEEITPDKSVTTEMLLQQDSSAKSKPPSFEEYYHVND